MSLFSINEIEIFSGIDNFLKELDPTNPNSTMGKELQKLDFTSPHTELGQAVGEFDLTNPNSAISRIRTEIDPTRNTSLMGKLLTEINIIAEDLRSEHGEDLRPADGGIFRTYTINLDEFFKAIDFTNPKSLAGKGLAEIDPTNPKSLAGEGLAEIDPTNPKSLVGEGLAEIDGFLDISKAIVKTEIGKIVGEGVTDGLFRIHHHETKFTTLNSEPLRPNEKTYFVLHGWESNPEYMRGIADALKKNPNANIVLVNWEKDADYLTYFPAALRTELVAHDVSNYIMENKISPENVTMIGHSLGAHVAGMASREIYERTGHKVDEVVGLDPAGPGFGLSIIINGFRPISGSMLGLKGLTKTDASQVVVFHTAENTLGAFYPIGHTDFYVNSDRLTQPGMGYLDIAGNHSYSIRLFVDTLEGKHTEEFPELDTETLSIKKEGTFHKEIK
ncbi:MAG: hypothetical protein IM585_10085 [Pseudanabaena sp. M135S2SP2A07QC]|jgi:pimeloyl-ACP methyl ester carboxylesterase|nr:hypothetical protein [Pseudanabaena sp. M051S1SP2A07QC]MCA6525135.1 hypothetical protein [Pseudanabaena sp. M179S2SP2A07QC]MCA6531464.1 hypothetical protein [Pseudanabaena sp. M125S2SP2A07QC]MCA6532991.1 hypothetical protein [Pseudanabaena sp. M176S2SP2A07QC]MCA6538482.1 hypothetical protein [Pseudanabaena sp. M037S2SP2A07QC]MCA6543055.1 hypothetical protein [Pseudanabaena sp. M074S1SP2A07QC]MCA6546571.1 hypothetical protein [Pseudanabaena sp. M152S2SP2A07QC]MCA6552337.1 hypothetical prot